MPVSHDAAQSETVTFSVFDYPLNEGILLWADMQETKGAQIYLSLSIIDVSDQVKEATKKISITK